ncbi:hypothetical protein D187_007499 [Cystobacter fuscus DSM 2262]|uniref:Uncharacterized protein n=1 Tax=Cystobacter fuscus (strain ATCC 25194 / DSM 2262 / NBRC 100088 / M29) TaxID=1242864 RepID=S9P1N3_CYSF2|nr:hypothetical protein [Cystobacter fuscus]EPX56157.1 hypothetical protein D187_007499 [Cystobacter fuscus DSM 2262]
MSDVASIKHSLLRAPWREYTRLKVEGLDGPVELVIRRPPDSVLEKLLRSLKEKGLDAAGGEEKDPESALHFRARVVATCVFLPNAVAPLFTEDEVLDWPGVAEVSNACMAAINPAKALENARGN